MNILIAIIIFLCKVIENALATLRLIVVSNGKKMLGALLNGIIALIWVLTTGAVVINVNENLLKIVAFCIGSFVGSYIGSLLEEKIALGNNIITAIIPNQNNELVSLLRNKGYAVTVIKGEGYDDKRKILIILNSRKKRSELLSYIKEKEKKSVIMSQPATPIQGFHLIR